MAKELLGSLELNRIYQMDCLEGMKLIPNCSIDMILCDLPYGTTQNKWDVVIPFEQLWEQYERIIKENGAIVLTASQPFTSYLVMSNRKLFKYEWIWQKTKASGHLNAKKMPMKNHENILVFYKKLPTYNPQGLVDGEFNNSRPALEREGTNYGKETANFGTSTKGNYPKTVQVFANPSGKGHLHPTQKPVSLFEYLIKTYTNENEIVLDNCIGSGTTAVAALKTNRKFIGFEIESKYIEIANQRIESTYNELTDNKILEELQ
jgi:site-specific DNA-methyltransferase (adenine-specific)